MFSRRFLTHHLIKSSTIKSSFLSSFLTLSSSSSFTTLNFNSYKLNSTSSFHFSRQLSTDLQPIKDYLINLEFEESEKDRILSYNGLQVIRIASTRSLEFNTPEEGNYLIKNNLYELKKRLNLLKGNWTANAIFIGSKSLYVLSNGIHNDDIETDGIEIIKQVQEISEIIEYYPEQNLRDY